MKNIWVRERGKNSSFPENQFPMYFIKNNSVYPKNKKRVHIGTIIYSPIKYDSNQIFAFEPKINDHYIDRKLSKIEIVTLKLKGIIKIND